MLNFILKLIFGDYNKRKLKTIYPLVEQINQRESYYQSMSDDQLKQQIVLLKNKLQSNKTLDNLLVDTFALVREVSKRTLGMRHFDVQLIGGIALARGEIAEMKTGEGKTLVSTLAVTLHALQGKVHIVTVNDYLAQRDCEWMEPLYRFLGLKVAYLYNHMPSEEKMEAYQADILYATSSELGFDYLRDHMVFQAKDQVQKERYFCLIDEVDSVLIDEARTPLIISGAVTDNPEKYHIANMVIPKLKIAQRGEDKKWLPHTGDFHFDEKERSVMLTEDGVTNVEQMLGIQDIYQPESLDLLHAINQALRAHCLYLRDKEYLVENGEVVIIDENTGRKMIGRRFSDGLHQAIEAKEKVAIQQETQTLASVTVQNYFKLYPILAGMTGTAKTEAIEFMKIYNLDILEIPTNKVVLRKDQADKIYKNKLQKHKAIVEEIKLIHQTQAPILVGTISVEQSEELSKFLKKEKLVHSVLNAKNHSKEAEIIAQAGALNSITLATNMAGRGTDIVLGGNPQYQINQVLERIFSKEEMKQKRFQRLTKILLTGDYQELESFFKEEHLDQNLSLDKVLDELFMVRKRFEENQKKVIELGGLHIVGSERHESRRVDNQLRGRAGRQGDPGSSQFFLSLEDDLLRLFGSDRLGIWLERAGFKDDEAIEHSMISNAIERAQRKVEARNFEIRKHLLEYDEILNLQRKYVYKVRNDLIHLGVSDQFIGERLSIFIDDVVSKSENQHEAKGNKISKAIYLDLCEKLSLFPHRDYEQKTVIDKDEIIKQWQNEYFDRMKYISSSERKDLERNLYLQTLDLSWKNHLYSNDELREGMNLRSYAQKNPLIEYKIESFRHYHDMLSMIEEDFLKTIFHIQIQFEERDKLETRSNHKMLDLSNQFKQHTKMKRNEPCFCGSGKKYKHCHGK